MNLSPASLSYYVVVLLLLILLTCSCETRVHVRAIEGQTPTFTCDHPKALNGLIIFRIPNEYINQDGIPGDVLTEQAVVWGISGERQRPDVPITYGKLPAGMREFHSVKPLEEGGFYLIKCSQNDNGGCYGHTFVIQDGKAIIR